MEYLKVKNWEEYQHYKDRCPPWIKLHTKLLNDFDFMELPPTNKCLLMLLWILASENDGKIKNDLTEIKFRLRDNKIKESDINLLIDKGFLVGCKQTLADASTMLADARLETETETEKRQTLAQSFFEKFWTAYPKKKSKGQAKKAFLKLKPDEHLLATMLAKIERAKKSESWVKDNGKYIPYPATWLNAEGWEDDDETPGLGRSLDPYRDYVRCTQCKNLVVRVNDEGLCHDCWMNH